MFSVVIPLYNKAHTIKKTLSTVLTQTYQEFEVVVVDDGSTDDGVSVIKRFFNDERIRIISQQNQGVSVARNTGIKESKYNYIAFLDGDDEWLPDYLDYVKKTIATYEDVGLIIMGRYGQNLQTGIRNSAVPRFYENKIEVIDFFHNPHVFAHVSATVVKKSLISDSINSWGGFVPGQRSNEDFLFLFRVALHTKVAYCGFPLAIYNGGVEGQATSTIAEQKRFDDSLLFHNLVFDEWEHLNRANLTFKIFMAYEIRHIIYINLINKNYNQIDRWVTNLHEGYFQYIFLKLEFFLYQRRILNKLMMIFIGLTKLRWRLRGYPRVMS